MIIFALPNKKGVQFLKTRSFKRIKNLNKNLFRNIKLTIFALRKNGAVLKKLGLKIFEKINQKICQNQKSDYLCTPKLETDTVLKKYGHKKYKI